MRHRASFVISRNESRLRDRRNGGPDRPAAVLMDLAFGGSSTIRPTADCGYRAATAASSEPVAEGNVGAGAGATVELLGGTNAP